MNNIRQENKLPGGGTLSCEYPKVLTQLHDDILLNVFSYLSYTDLTQVRLVCRHLMDCIANKHFSKKFCLKIKKHNVMDMYRQLKKSGGFITGTFYSHMVYSGTEARHSNELQFILQKLGVHVRSLKVIKFFPFKSLYSYFTKLENLDIEGFSANMKLNLNAFRNLRGIHFVGPSVKSSSSKDLLVACLRKNTEVKLEELSICIYSKYAELFLTVLNDHAHTLKCLHLINDEMIVYSSIEDKWVATFSELKKLRKVKLEVSNTEIIECILNCLESLPLRYLEAHCSCSSRQDIIKVIESSSQTLEHLALIKLCLLCPSDGINKISENCVNLKRLILCSTMPLEEKEVCNIAEKLINLEVLVLHSCEGVTNKSLGAIFQHLTQLRELDLSGNKDINVSALKGSLEQPYSIQRLRILEKLNFKSCDLLSDDDFLLTLKFPFLRYLFIGQGFYTKAGLESLVRECPLLEKLSITHSRGLTCHEILPIVKSLRRLRFLHLGDCSYVFVLENGRYLPVPIEQRLIKTVNNGTIKNRYKR